MAERAEAYNLLLEEIYALEKPEYPLAEYFLKGVFTGDGSNRLGRFIITSMIEKIPWVFNISLGKVT